MPKIFNTFEAKVILMKKNMTRRSISLLLFLYLSCCAITTAQKIPDSLKNKSFDYLVSQSKIHGQDSTKTWIYLNSILAKGKKEKDNDIIAHAYENMAYKANGRLEGIYADSLVSLAKKVKDRDFMAKAYLTRGMVYYSQKKYKRALNNYITAHEYAYDSKDLLLKSHIKYSIATIKLYLGFYSDAAVLFQEAIDYFKSRDESGYKNSLLALGMCYNKMDNYDLCSATNTLGIKLAEDSASIVDRDYFIFSEGINDFSRQNYKTAIQKIEQALPSLIKSRDFANETVSYFYIGKSYLSLNDEEKAVAYFKKVEDAFIEKDYIRPDLRENFEILLDYYKQKGSTATHYHCIEMLMKVDNALNKNFKYLSGKIHKEYDTRELMFSKNKLEEELKLKEKVAYILYTTITILFFFILFLLYRYYRNQHVYKQKFGELMFVKTQNEDRTEEKEETESKKIDINPEVVTGLVKHLEKFENNKKFLKKDLTLVSLAAALGTNTNYLSKVINYSKNKNYITYINDLRIDYIIAQLKNDSKFRNYTIKALAEEAGFSTAQHFSKAFYAKTGIYPSYFVTELNRGTSN